MAPPKSAITLTELVLLSIVWSSTQFVWTNVIKQGLTSAIERLRLSKYTTDVIVAMVLLACVFAMVLLFANVNIGRSSVFQLTDDQPAISFPLGGGRRQTSNDSGDPSFPEAIKLVP